MSVSKATNKDIINEFTKAVAVLQVIDKKPFRVRAYQKAIETVENLDEEVSQIAKKQDLSDLPGIGKELAQKMTDLFNTGQSKGLQKLYDQVPSGMFSLLDIPGLGAKRAYQLATTFDLQNESTSTEEVKKLATLGKLQDLPGFGPKLESQILENISRTKPKSKRFLLDEADKIANKIIKYLKICKAVEKTQTLGSIRRRKETVGDIDIGIATHNPAEIIKHLKTWDYAMSVQALGKQVIRLVVSGNIQVDIKMIPIDQWGSMLQHFTGSKFHNLALREKSIKVDLSLSEHGIKRSNVLKKYSLEKDFYSDLGLDFIPPELRENTGEILASSKGKLPSLVSLDHINGDFHTHTDFEFISSHDHGDGIELLLEKAEQLNYSWLAFGDHNPSRSSYNHTKMHQLLTHRTRWIEQKYSSWKERVKRPAIKIFITLETDMLEYGQLAIPQASHHCLDFVIASSHSHFNLSSSKQTKRILTALSLPKVKILAHPTCRVINKRVPISADWEKIYKYCATHRIALEVNGTPKRLDLPDSMIKEAKKHGCKFALGSDSHFAKQLEYMTYAVSTARRGWAEKDDILNTYSYNKLVKFFFKRG